MAASSDAAYSESVPNPWWLMATLWLCPPLMLVGAVAVWRDESGISRVIGVSILLGLVVVLVPLARWLTALRIEVTPAALRYGWGPMGATRRWADVLGAEVEPYRWLTYGGWGLRFALGKRRAYSVPGVRFGVLVRTRDGKRTHLASRQPEALCAAIRARIPASPDARGGHE